LERAWEQDKQKWTNEMRALLIKLCQDVKDNDGKLTKTVRICFVCFAVTYPVVASKMFQQVRRCDYCLRRAGFLTSFHLRDLNSYQLLRSKSQKEHFGWYLGLPL
jgi:hypothetical protein